MNNKQQLRTQLYRGEDKQGLTQFVAKTRVYLNNLLDFSLGFR